jgi:hypothetical protein
LKRPISIASLFALTISTFVIAPPAGAAGCTITGTPRADVLRGTVADDVICGLGGDDTIISGAGDDILRGGQGADELVGGSGIDELVGAAGEDLLKGGPGDDVLKGGPAADVLNGGLGLDFCSPLDVLDVLTNCEDVRAPRLQAFSIEPGTIDTSLGSQTILVKAHITDDESGLNDGYGAQSYSFSRVFFTGPEGSNAEFYAEFRPGSDDPERNLVSGTATDGFYEVSVTLPQYSAQGRWKINYVSLEDEATNHRYLWREDLQAAGLPTGFDQVGPGDTVAPDVSALSLSSSTVDTSEGPANIEVTASVTDDLSGVESAWLTFKSPTDRQYLFVALGPDEQGRFVGVLDVPRYTPQGTWTLDQIDLRDRADNYRALTASQLSERGLATSFEQVGAGDTTPPRLLEFDFTPKEVDTRYEDQPITVTARITDDLAGVAEATVMFRSPSGECSASCPEDMQHLLVRLTPAERISGGEHDGVYQATVTLPRYSKLGTWTVYWIQIPDRARNELLLYEKNDDPTLMGGRKGEVSALGFPVSFTNGGTLP